jgi:hypothetical protein
VQQCFPSLGEAEVRRVASGIFHVAVVDAQRRLFHRGFCAGVGRDSVPDAAASVIYREAFKTGARFVRLLHERLDARYGPTPQEPPAAPGAYDPVAVEAIRPLRFRAAGVHR